MNQKLTEKTPTHLLLAHSDAEREVLQSRLPNLGPRVATVVWVDGQKCVMIPLTRGKSVLIDFEDFETVGHLRWCAIPNGYTWYAGRRQYPERVFQRMHSMLLGFPAMLQVDHRNGDGLDNRRLNIRLATQSQNMRNRRLLRNNTSGYQGVSFMKKEGLWRARTWSPDKRYLSLGCYPTRELAAQAYDTAVKKLAGDFAKLNFL